MGCLWEADCDGRARPDSTEICHDTAECSWILGVSVAHLSCTSYNQNFLPIAPRMLDFRWVLKFTIHSECQSRKSFWHVECYAMHFPHLRWGSCSATCGNGFRTREISCSSGMWERRCRVWKLEDCSFQNRKGTTQDFGNFGKEVGNVWT